MADSAPIPFIKKRTKIRPSSSSSSLRSLSFADPAEEEGAEEEGNVAVVRIKKKSLVGKVRDRESDSKGGRGKSRLSFGGAGEEEGEGGEGDEEEPTIIKTSTPRKLLRPSSSASTSTSQSTIQTASPSVYSKEYLNQLKQSTLSTPPPSHHLSSSTTTTGNGEYDDLTRSKFSTSALEESSTSIPTESFILSAREKREQIRLHGVSNTGSGRDQDGFIALDVVHVGGDSEGKKKESRFVREDQEGEDGDDLDSFTGSSEKVPLGTKANREAALKMRSGMEELILDAEEEDDGDEEMREWEESQIRRAGGRVDRSDKENNGGKKSIKEVYRAPKIPTPTSLPNLSSLSSSLRTHLSTLKTAHSLSTSQLTHFSHERSEIDQAEQELREEVEIAERKRRWFESFKEWAEGVDSFLIEKYPPLEHIELSSLTLLRERTLILSSRRYASLSDLVSLFTGLPVPTIPPSLSTSPSEEDPTTLEPYSPSRLSRRTSPISPFSETLPSSSLETFESDLSSLSTLLTSLFSDVTSPSFRNPVLGIIPHFKEFRTLWLEEYLTSYGGLMMIGVWEFWIRLEVCVGWNPFGVSEMAEGVRRVEDWEWWKGVVEFEEDGGEEEEGLVKGVVEKIVVGRLGELVKGGVWDVWSEKGNKGALRWVGEISGVLEKSGMRFTWLIQQFLFSISSTISQSLSLLPPSTLSRLTLPSTAFTPSSFSARIEFAKLHLGLIKNLLGWRYWCKNVRLPSGNGDGEERVGETLDEMVLVVVGKLVLPIVEAGWGTGGEEIGKEVLELLPADLVPEALKRRLEGEGVA